MPHRVRVHKRRTAAGFTLTELLVVVAITIIMMGLLLGPLSQTFNLTSRGRTMIAAQDNARAALAQITRELQDAMVVYDNLPLNLWHYSKYDTSGDPPRPTPSDDAVPIPYTVTGAMVDLVMPRMRYYCTTFDHYLNVVEVSRDGSQIDTRRVAIDTCPRAGHESSPVEPRPMEPLQPDEFRVRYFLGLNQPGLDPNDPNAPVPGSPNNRTDPHYANGFLFQGVAANADNLYVLYRVEFDPNVNTPAGQRTRNWLLANGQPNPNFFYQPPFSLEWKSRTSAVVTTADVDLVRMVQTGDGGWRPEPTVRFIPSPVANETLNANTATASFESTGVQGAPRPPTQYAADFGSWSGPTADGSQPLTPSVILTTQPPPPGAGAALARQYVYGPRIQVFAQPQAGGRGLDLVYDSGVPASQEPRQRLFTWDSRRGIVNFALRRIQFPPPMDGDAETFSATVTPEFTADLKEDRATAQVPAFNGATETVPTGFGLLKQDSFLGPWARIVPGSETVTRVVDRVNSRSVLMERAGYTGLGVAGGDQFVAQADLEPNQYSIDYSTGVITFSDRDPTLLEARQGGSQAILVRYQFQTNRSTDVVRATYATRELMTVQLGLMQFEPRSGDAQNIQLTSRVRVRNTK